jgi:orotate phosphoribosyltransferase
VARHSKPEEDYLDCKRTTLSNTRGLQLVSKLLLDRVRALKLAGKRVDAIGGLTIGAAPLSIAVSQLALREDGWDLPVFVVRDEQKTHGTQRAIEGGVQPGWGVVVVDDVMTTGKSVLKAIHAVEQQEATVAAVLILIDREERGVQALHKYDVESLFSYKQLLAD